MTAGKRPSIATPSDGKSWACAAMSVVWGRVEGTIMMDPQAKIVEMVETKTY
jgi:hypothetical protein